MRKYFWPHDLLFIYLFFKLKYRGETPDLSASHVATSKTNGTMNASTKSSNELFPPFLPDAKSLNQKELEPLLSFSHLPRFTQFGFFHFNHGQSLETRCE